MRFAPVKRSEQQAVLMLHRTRGLLVRQRTKLVKALRGHMAEFGIVARKGVPGVISAAARPDHESKQAAAGMSCHRHDRPAVHETGGRLGGPSAERSV